MTTLDPFTAPRKDYSIWRWRYFIPLAAFVVAALVDVCTTEYTPRGFTGSEADPIAAWVFNHFGRGTIVVPLLIVPILVVLGLKLADRFAWRFVAVGLVAVLYLAAAAHGLTDVHNVLIAHSNGSLRIMGPTVINHTHFESTLATAARPR